MLTAVSRLIFRNRPTIIAILLAFTAFMAYEGTSVKLSYESASLLSNSDSTLIRYNQFKQKFGEDGNVLVIGIQDDNIFKLSQFNAWYDLGNQVHSVNGVQEVVSMARTINLVKNTETHHFDFVPLVRERPTTQAEVDTIEKQILGLKFYQGLLYNPKTHACLMAVTLDKKKLNDISRITIVKDITTLAKAYQQNEGVRVHFSGLPYIRTVTTQKVKNELGLFIIMSLVVAALIMFLFFKSVKVVLSSLIVVAISIVWVLGTTALFGYKITILTGVIPSLVVIIAIENCIYILNKYHWEFRSHGNKIKALTRVVQRIGLASLMTNAATAIGFAAFILVPNQMLREFGVVTAINVMLEFVLCITLLPIIFSYLAPPDDKHTKHLSSSFFSGMLNKIIYAITHKRKLIYGVAGTLLLFGAVGISLIKTSGKVVDDLQKSDPIYLDLEFFEHNFGGVMPFEISVDTKKKNGAMQYSTIEKINQLQEKINKHPQFSKPLSMAEMLKFARQAYYGGKPSMYSLPNSMENNFVIAYIPQKMDGKRSPLHSFLDSTKQVTRISFQMADLGTKKMDALTHQIQQTVDSIFPKDRYNVIITGNSVVYAKGTNFLIRNLFQSVAIAIILISLLMALLFSSFKMILVSMIPNIIPLLITAALMGFIGIPIKPSTIIVFSIALGISVDNAIQYLSRYRHELKVSKGDIKHSVIFALREAGFSMIYTSIVLVLGFSVFIVSGFGGTQALGILISTTLFIAMFFNIMVLPSLLLTIDKRWVSKSFTEEPILEVFEDEYTDTDQPDL
ncbi:MAG TPA: MMPL family transporter [Williamwhitmania sp.]|nr:MMPL family transporter [Williamwhitmania sp.]